MYTPSFCISDLDLVIVDRWNVALAGYVFDGLVDLEDCALDARLQRLELGRGDDQQLFLRPVAPNLDVAKRCGDLRRIVLAVVDAGGDDDRPNVWHRSGALKDATDVVEAGSSKRVDRGVGR